MTLEQAIEHAEEVADEKLKNTEFIKNNPYGDKSKIQGCVECAAEHRQIAAWLRELQERREKDNKIGRGNARWLINSDGYYPYCSACMTEPKDGIMTDFCPSCGAKMEGKIT